ncbi:tyrosine-type recombinase/integrase [Selenomonas noxia]|uniref:tyrosine-type recombinase/integrase n=1 Tax=Selenomonas noxia TaxID=135083 RepID=UPI003C73D182
MSKIRIRKRGKTYSYSFDISKNPRRMKEKGGYATEDEAYEAGVKAYADWKSGNIGITSEKIKLRDYLAVWLENVVRPNVKRTTHQNYSRAIKDRILVRLGGIYLQDLRPRDVAAWVQELASKGFAAGTITQAKSVLSAALKYAVYPAELIAVNPATNIPIPRCAPRKVVKRVIVTPEQFAAIPRGSTSYPAIKIMYHSGMRISETLGLTWEDIDLNTGKICVSRQRFEEGYFDTPKTESSARVFYADASFIAYLRALRAEQAEHQMRFGQAYQLAYEDSRDERALVLLPKKIPAPDYLLRRSLVCIRPNGVPLHHTSVTLVLRKAGLNPHSFRHTHATKLIEAGAKPVDVAARLGHANANITQNLYAHDTEDMMQETARIFGDIVGK